MSTKLSTVHCWLLKIRFYWVSCTVRTFCSLEVAVFAEFTGAIIFIVKVVFLFAVKLKDLTSSKTCLKELSFGSVCRSELRSVMLIYDESVSLDMLLFLFISNNSMFISLFY